MSISFQIASLEAMTLAFTFDSDEAAAIGKIDRFATAIGVPAARRFQVELAITQRGVRNVTYIRYAAVPKGTGNEKDINIIDLPAGEFVRFTATKEEYTAFADGAMRTTLDEFMKTNNLGYDMSKVFALAEPIVADGVTHYDIIMPVKRK